MYFVTESCFPVVVGNVQEVTNDPNAVDAIVNYSTNPVNNKFILFSRAFFSCDCGSGYSYRGSVSVECKGRPGFDVDRNSHNIPRCIKCKKKWTDNFSKNSAY